MSKSITRELIVKVLRTRTIAREVTLLSAFLLASSPALSADVWTICRPVEVMAKSDGGVHVRCEKAVQSIVYFAASATSDQRFANRVVAIAASAQVAQKTVLIAFDPADSMAGPPLGCLAANCRLIHAIGISEEPAP